MKIYHLIIASLLAIPSLIFTPNAEAHKHFNKVKNINFTLEKLVLITNLQYKLTKIKVISMTNMNNKFEADTGKILDIVINSCLLYTSDAADD